MGDTLSDEPAITGRTEQVGADIGSEPAIVPSGENEIATPLAALGNEPALRGGETLPDYAEVYRQFRDDRTPGSGWGLALLVAIGSALVAAVMLALPVGLSVARLFGTEPPGISFSFNMLLPALVGAMLAVPGLVWVERQPWTIPNRWVLAGATSVATTLGGLALAVAAVVSTRGSTAMVAVALLALIIPGGMSALAVVRVFDDVDRGENMPDATLAIPFTVVAGISATIGMVVGFFV